MVSIRLVFIFIFILNITYSQEVNWISMDKAQELQKKVPKNIMMDVYTDWCGPCKLLDKNTFQNPDVSRYIREHYYAVKFNACLLYTSPSPRDS